MKKYIILLFILTSCKFKQKVQNSPSIWIDYWHPKEHEQGGNYYNNCIKLNDHQYLYVGRDSEGKVFDSTIITINP